MKHLVSFIALTWLSCLLLACDGGSATVFDVDDDDDTADDDDDDVFNPFLDGDSADDDDDTDEDGDEEDDTPQVDGDACTNDETRCSEDGSQVERCENGQWVTEEDCSQCGACVSGQCEASDCSYRFAGCEDNALVYESPNGETCCPTRTEACTDGKSCNAELQTCLLEGACNEVVKASHRRKIYSGERYPTGIDIPPGQVLAVGALTDPSGSNFCTGTLISDRVVMTAAHCVVERWGSGTIRPSEVLFAIGPDSSNPVASFGVQSVAAHSEYNRWGSSAAYDMAVLVLSESVFTTHPEITPIPINEESLTQSLVGGWMQSVGYGGTNLSSGDNNTEQFWVPELLDRFDATSLTVNGRGFGSVCFGDSGGPSLRRVDGLLKTFGAVSWGDQSCVDYDHYSRLDTGVDWILGFVSDAGAPDCSNFPDGGFCDGPIWKQCQNGAYAATDCRGEGKSCGSTQAGTVGCVDDPCQGLGWVGECRDGNAVWCQDGELTVRTCEACGESCTWVSHDLGMYCE